MGGGVCRGVCGGVCKGACVEGGVVWYVSCLCSSLHNTVFVPRAALPWITEMCEY